MSPEGPAPPPAPRRLAWPSLLGIAGTLLLVADALALAGFFARDRNVPLALLMYLPLAPPGLASTALDLARQGRAVRGPRFILAAAGVLAMTCSAAAMIGSGPRAPAPAAGGEVRLLHWNVLWGGRPRTEATWTSIEEDVVRRAPDVVVLSEGPSDARLDSLTRRLGPGWTSTKLAHPPRSPDWYKLVAMSRWPVREGRPVAIRNGIALDVRVDRPGRPLRILIVDGRSRPTLLRTPMLLDVAAECRRAAEAGEPYDVLAGDFNALGRSLGFDAVRSAAGGYEEASRSAAGWRGTWPMPLPVYDIDHVWVGAGLRVAGCRLFGNPGCDHRGQLVRLAIP